MNAEVYKVVKFPFGGETITINVYKGKTRGVYTYLFDLNGLKQLDFDDIDFSNTFYEISGLVYNKSIPFVGFVSEKNGGREISFTLNAGQKLQDKNPDVTSLNEPKTNLGFVMQELKKAIVKVFNEKNNNPSGIVAKWDVGDIVLRETKNGNAEVVEIENVDLSAKAYNVIGYSYNFVDKRIYDWKIEPSIDDFDKISKDITFEVGDVFSVELGNGYEEVTVFSIDTNGYIKIIDKNNGVVTNSDEDSVKRFLLRSGARVYQSMQKTPKPKYKVGDYILYEVGGIRYVYKVNSVNDTQKTYIISYKDYKKNIEEATSIDWSNLEGRSELLKIKDGDRFVVNIQKLQPLEIVIKKPNSSNSTNEFVLIDAGNGAAFTNVKTAEEIKDLLYQWLASEVKNTASGNNQAKYKVGDIVFFALNNGTKSVVKVVEITPTDYKYERHVWNPTVMMLEKKSNEVSIDTFHTLASDISFSVGDKFAVNGGKEYKDVEVTSLAGNLVKIDYKGKSGVYAYGIYDLVVGNLFTSGALKGTTAKNLNLSNTTNPSSAVSANNEPHNFIFAKNSGNIYALVVDKVQQDYVDLIHYENGKEYRSVNVPIQTIAKSYSAINVDKHREFLIPAQGLPPIKVYYTTASSKNGITHILLKDDGKEYARYARVFDMLHNLFLSEAKVVLQEKIVEQTEDLIDEKTKSFFDEEIEQLNKDIAQLMFFKSLLSPIDFEKKIEISQEITKKQEEVNKLNFYLLEKRLQSDNIFDELFEQSFTPIKNAYSGVYTAGEDETDFFTPDGQKSKLSDSLNVMIRTPQFKAWFGDWELAYIYKDTDAVEIDCSKVLTDNFEPMLVWHGTGQEFSYFKFDTFPAAYFAVNSQYSQFFADLHGGEDGFVIPFFLNIRNPLDLTHFKTNDISVKDFFDYIFLQTGMDMDDLEVNPIFMDDTLKPMQTWIYIRNNPNMLKKIAALNVFDGIRFYETNPNIKDKNSQAYQTEAFITFNANQSKIADPERGTILLASMKSFILEKGGAI